MAGPVLTSLSDGDREALASTPKTPRNPTPDEMVQLRGMAMSSDKATATRAMALLGKIASSAPDGRFRQVAKGMLWEAANPGQPFPDRNAPQDASYSSPDKRAKEAAAGTGYVYQEEGGFVPGDTEAELLAKSGRDESGAPKQKGDAMGMEKKSYPRELHPSVRKQVLYNLATAPTLGHNVLPALADYLTGEQDFTPAAMAEYDKEAPLTTTEDIGSKLAGGSILGMALSALRPLTQGASLLGSAAKGAAVEGGALAGLNVASGAAEGALSQEEAANGLARLVTGQGPSGPTTAWEGAKAAADPTKIENIIPPLLGGITGGVASFGRALGKSSPSASYLRSQGAKVGPGTAGSGAIFEGEIGQAGVGPGGKVTDASLRAAERAAVERAQNVLVAGDIAPNRIGPEFIAQAERDAVGRAQGAVNPTRIQPEHIKAKARDSALTIDELMRQAHDDAQGAYNSTLAAAGERPMVDIDMPVGVAREHVTRAANTSSEQGAIMRELLGPYLDNPRQPGLAERIRVVRPSGETVSYLEAAKSGGVNAGDRIQAPSDLVNEIRQKMSDPAGFDQKLGGSKVFQDIAMALKNALEGTPEGAANDAYTAGVSRIENAKRAFGYSGPNAKAAIDPSSPVDRRPVENAIQTIAKERAVAGDAGQAPEFRQAISDFPTLRSPIEELQATMGKANAQDIIERGAGKAARELPVVGPTGLAPEVAGVLKQYPGALSPIEELSSTMQKGAAQDVIESSFGRAAGDLPFVGYERLAPELRTVLDQNAAARRPLEELAALYARRNLQMGSPRTYPRLGSSGPSVASTIPWFGEATDVRLISPLLQVPDMLTPGALSLAPEYLKTKNTQPAR